MSAKQKLHDLVGQLPASGTETAVEFLEPLVKPPIDPDMLARIDAARQHSEAIRLGDCGSRRLDFR